jgi:hypothetical protein
MPKKIFLNERSKTLSRFLCLGKIVANYGNTSTMEIAKGSGGDKNE